MAMCRYEDCRLEIQPIIDMFLDADIPVAAYNRGIQLNVDDEDGITHSYYPTTCKAVFHKFNGRDKYGKYSPPKTIENITVKQMITYCKNPDTIQKLFKEDNNL